MSLQVRTSSGVIEGRERNGALLFAGIPYAAAPIGALRFCPPQPHDGWRGVRECKRFGLAAPQRPGAGLIAQPLAWDEDCLTLNVCTPAADDRARPVMVWMHGGAFRTGKGGIPWYDGTSFATRGDIVTVTLNYRLGALGFAHLAELGGSDVASSGLNGILDQVAALEWVRANIAAFGGDPQRVTVAGESAGGMSVATLLGLPRARGLFRGAIPQSGGASHCIQASEGAAIVKELLRELRVSTLAELRALDVDTILDAQQRVEQTIARSREIFGVDVRHLGDMVFLPVIDGRELPASPLAQIREGLSREVAVLVGTNRDETTLWGVTALDEDRLTKVAARYFSDPAAAIAVYRAARPSASCGEIEIALTTDQMFRIPAIRLAEAQVATGGSAWSYFFTWPSPAFGGKLGATHALEIPFAWNNLAAPGTEVLLGKPPYPDALATAMHGAWTAFIRDGHPSCPQLPSWPRYDTTRRAVMELGLECRVLDDPAASERRLWTGVR